MHGWVGLGLTQLDRPTDPAVRALLGAPELVLAVVQGLRSRGSASVAPDPVELASWLGHGLEPLSDTIDPAGWPIA